MLFQTTVREQKRDRGHVSSHENFPNSTPIRNVTMATSSGGQQLESPRAKETGETRQLCAAVPSGARSFQSSPREAYA